jgi:hypothetical protein
MQRKVAFMIHHRPGSQIDEGSDQEGEVSGNHIIAIRRDLIVARARKLGIPKSDLSKAGTAVAAIVHEAWTGMASHDVSRLDLHDDFDYEAVRRDSTYYTGSEPGPGLVAGLRYLPELSRLRGTSSLFRVGQLIELHGLYTIRVPAEFGSEWSKRLDAIGQDIQRGAQALYSDPEANTSMLRGKLSFLGRTLNLLDE